MHLIHVTLVRLRPQEREVVREIDHTAICAQELRLGGGRRSHDVRCNFDWIGSARPICG